MLSRLRRLSPKTLKADLSAGLTTALVAIPDGVASRNTPGRCRRQAKAQTD